MRLRAFQRWLKRSVVSSLPSLCFHSIVSHIIVVSRCEYDDGLGFIFFPMLDHLLQMSGLLFGQVCSLTRILLEMVELEKLDSLLTFHSPLTAHH